MLTAPDKKTLDKYHIGTLELKLLVLTIAIPYVIIWLVSLIGYLRLKNYASLINKDRDGAAFDRIANGVFYLSVWLPTSAIISNFFAQVYRSNPSATANLVRLENYINLIILGVGFWLVYSGSRKLLPIISRPNFVASQSAIMAYVAFAAMYVSLILHDPARETPTAAVTVATYYEPDLLILLTLVIPRLIFWFLGLQAVQNIYLYRTRVKGRLYKAALHNLTIGLGTVIAVTILLRTLSSLSTSFASLNLTSILLVIYLLLILLAVGYVFIAKGAKNLQKLEES